MKFNWLSKQPSPGVVTIYETNITLNKSASVHFESAYNVMLGLDYEKKLIGIRPLSKEQCSLGHIPGDKRYKISVRPSYSRVSNKNFIKELSSFMNFDFSTNQNYKFSTTWDDSEKVLIVDLNKSEV